MEHAASPSLISLGFTTDPSSEGSSFRWGLAASFILHTLVIVMAMFVRFPSENEKSFRSIDVALISLPSMPMTAPSPKSVVAPRKKSAVTQPPQKVISPPPAPTVPPVEETLPPLPTATASERLSESLGGAINSIVVPRKQATTSTPIPSREPNLQPSEDQAPLLENLQLPSAPPTIAQPLPTATASERLSESLGGAINSIVVPRKQAPTSTPIPSREPDLQPSEDQAPLLENLQLPSAPPMIARPKPLQRAEPLKIPSTPPPSPTVVPKKTPAMSKPQSRQSSISTPKAQPTVKPAPVIPSLSEVTPFKKSLPRTTPLKNLPAPNIEESLKHSLPDMPTPSPRRNAPKVSRKPLKIQPDQKSSIPQVPAPPLVKIPESPQTAHAISPKPPLAVPPPSQPPLAVPPSSQPPLAAAPPKMTETVKKLMKGLKSTIRTPAPKPAPQPRTKPVTTSPSIKSPPSVIDQRIAKLSIPEVAPVESIKQRLSQIQVQSLSDASTSASQQSPAENRYFAMIREAIDRRWVNPDVPISNKKVIITFQVEKAGEISRIHVEQSSGNTYYDSTILGAIHEANPLPEFPSDLQKSFLNIKFLFTMPEQ